MVEPGATPGATAETLSLHPRWRHLTHHHEETLKHMRPRLGLKELTLHTENEGGKSGCFYKLGDKKELCLVIGFLLEN